MTEQRHRNYHNYDRFPEKTVCCDSSEVFGTRQEILDHLHKLLYQHRVLVLDCYPGADLEEIRSIAADLLPSLLVEAESCLLSPEELHTRFDGNLGDDPVFGILSTANLEEAFDHAKLSAARAQIQAATGTVLVLGTGASLLCSQGVLVYWDMARWEIQLRYRAGMSNWLWDTSNLVINLKYKQGFFLEWRMADRHKEALLSRLDYIIDGNVSGKPKMVAGDAFRRGLAQLSQEPFRLVPYFDPGVWGGQWMKQVCSLPDGPRNYAWSFDGVPEENSIYLRFGAVRMEFPAMDLTLSHPQALLGKNVYSRFGAEFPIRFDFLDTVHGQNLSLQVHPLKSYIREKFHMNYTQDESYYILDTEGDDPCVYLGVKTGTDPEEMFRALEDAQAGIAPFPDERFINRLPVKRHDHVLIPAGTIHCSGKNSLVLEISATPYIFTFKLWDWARVGLDGRPRPIHLAHGKQNVQWNRDTAWVKQELIHRETVLSDSDAVKVERTGLHPLEFIETIRHTFTEPVLHNTCDTVNVLNLVQGRAARVESPDGHFAPFDVHYAETFIIPASVGPYIIRPLYPEEGPAMTIKASVRPE